MVIKLWLVRQESQSMLLDLLHLVQLKQNMEFYAEQQQVSFHLQAHQHNNNNNNNHHHHHHQAATSGQNSIFDQMSTSNLNQIDRTSGPQFRQANLNQHKLNHIQKLRDQQLQAQTTIYQCKPLDLSVKSSKQLIAATSEQPSNSNKCQQNRPAPINLSPQNSSSRHNLQDNHSTSSIHNSNKPNELITSSISPSSLSHSASSISSADSRCNEVISSTACSSIFPETNDIHPIAKTTQKKTTTKTTTNSNKSTSINLRRQKHKGAKSHLCLQCGQSFRRSDMLTRHSRRHSGLKPYQCGRCKQVFSRSDHLSTHERTHTGEKPYQCQFCDYNACRRDMITRHLRSCLRKRREEVRTDAEMVYAGEEGEEDKDTVSDTRIGLNRTSRSGDTIEANDISSSRGEDELSSVTQTV